MSERVLVSLEDVRITFGGKPLFDGIRVHICEGDKICLVGRNGAGKTTLMKLLMGELELDGGKRFLIPGLSIAYLAQKVDFDPESTVKNFVLSGLQKGDDLEEKHYLADMIIAPLGLDPDRKMNALSGGQLRRAALARTLLIEPDLLLLDEPTNHLDLGTIEWLENYLASYRGALVCVSHDRAFLRAIGKKVLWIDRGTIRTFSKGYDAFSEWADQILELEARAIQNMEKKMEAEVDWTQGGVSARRKRNVRRLRELHRLREKLKADKASYNQTMRTIDLDPLSPTKAAKLVAEFKQVGWSYVQEGKTIPILKDFNVRVLRGDRIGILGKNGSGKSTFLKLLIGEMEPTEGRIVRGKTIEFSYFDQNRSMLDPKKTVWDILCPDGGNYVFLGNDEDRKPVHVCGYLKNFLFDPRIARDLIATLSGGQQNRLMLARVLAHSGNVLILDEPTNDLDMDTLDMLQEILSDYAGTLIIVSHDRDFLDRTVTKVLAFEGDTVVDGYIGGYSDYLEAKSIREAKLESKRVASIAKQPAREIPQTHVVNSPSSEGNRPRTQMPYKLRHELEQLPKRIKSFEEELAYMKLQLDDPDFYIREPEAFDKVTRRYALVQADLEASEMRWIELEDQRAKLES